MRFTSESEAETERLGAAVGALLEPGDLIALDGPLGAGKTRFVAGLARGAGVGSRVRSPTFTLINEYHGRIPLLHVDLYRLEPNAVHGLALGEALDRAAIAVEWADRLPAALRGEALAVSIAAPRDDVRTFDVTATGARAAELLERWSVAAAGLRERT